MPVVTLIAVAKVSVMALLRTEHKVPIVVHTVGCEQNTRAIALNDFTPVLACVE